jgi:hypothetical protein
LAQPLGVDRRERRFDLGADGVALSYPDTINPAPKLASALRLLTLSFMLYPDR